MLHGVFTNLNKTTNCIYVTYLLSLSLVVHKQKSEVKYNAPMVINTNAFEQISDTIMCPERLIT